MPAAHHRHSPQLGMNEATTWSPGLDAGDTRTDGFDDPCPFVAAAEPVVIPRDVTGDSVMVGVTRAGGGNPHEHLAALRLVELQRLYLPLRTPLSKYCTTCLHVLVSRFRVLRCPPRLSVATQAGTVPGSRGSCRRQSLGSLLGV